MSRPLFHGFRLSFLLAAACVLALALPPRARAQGDGSQVWEVYMKRADCSGTLRDWMTVATQNPTGLGGSDSFELARHPQGVTFPRTPAGFMAAQLRADALRIAGFSAAAETGRLAKYSNYCCRTHAVWKRRQPDGSEQFSTVAGFGRPGEGFEPVASNLCCEEAAVLAKQAFGCGTFVTSTGAVIVFTGDGPRVDGPDPVSLEDIVIPPLAAARPKQPEAAGTPAKIGCFKDPNNPYDLDGHLSRSATNTPRACIETCRAKGFAYAGVQYGQSCLCGNSYGKFGPANNCDMACTGDASQTCGGYNSNMVYSTGIPAPSAQGAGRCPPNTLPMSDGRCIAVGRPPDR